MKILNNDNEKTMNIIGNNARKILKIIDEASHQKKEKINLHINKEKEQNL